MRALILTLFLAAPALAEEAGCPGVPDHQAEFDAIFAELARAPDATVTRPLSARLWALWLAAPDARAQGLLDQGMQRRMAGDLPGSVAILDELVAYCPDYAEGWNQRAFALFLARDYARALADIDAALAREPRHLGALTGKALILIGLGREDEAQEVLRAALALNPWLAERSLLRAPPGTDL
jgi:tetratricopeptide (TPR) repeat protein